MFGRDPPCIFQRFHVVVVVVFVVVVNEAITLKVLLPFSELPLKESAGTQKIVPTSTPSS